jgi:hypothetical protein
LSIAFEFKESMILRHASGSQLCSHPTKKFKS